MLRPQVREVIRLHSTSCPPQPQVGCQFNEQTNCPAIWATGQMRRFRTVCIPSVAGRGLGCNGVITGRHGNSWPAKQTEVRGKQLGFRETGKLLAGIYLSAFGQQVERMRCYWFAKCDMVVKLGKYLRDFPMTRFHPISLDVDLHQHHQHTTPHQHQHQHASECLMTSRVGEHDNHCWRHLPSNG